VNPRSLAVVTGASGGLGVPIVNRLAEAGYELALVDMNPAVNQQAEDLRAKGHVAHGIVANLSDTSGIVEVASAVRKIGSPLMLLVNNAGITRDARLAKMEVEQFDQVIEVNLLAAMRLTSGLADLFAEGASVVSMSSRAALGNFGQANYVTSKSALIGFTRALAQQWAPRVRANVVSPGLIDTPMTQTMPADVLAKLVDKVPAGRIGTPLDVANSVVFLASDQAAYITGQVLTVCGGRSLAP
jgi:3-oxoacyl-[acyl-carrier protein] reductase